jgi:O-antigen/teichoic acid export membrane protein
MTIRHHFSRVGQNTGVLFLVNVTGSVIGFLMAAALGRGLGDAGFGQYSFAMTWLLSLALFTEFGLSTVLTRDLAAWPGQTQSYLTNSLAAKFLLSLPVALLLLFFTPTITPGQNPEVIAALWWGIIFFYSGLVYSSFTAVFRAYQIMTPILWLTLIGQIVLFIGTLPLLLTYQALWTIIAWAGFSQSLQCGMAFIFYQKDIRPENPNYRSEKVYFFTPVIQNSDIINANQIKKLILKAWPFALAGFLAALQLRANILILAYLAGDQALGWYSAANRFVETGKQLPGAFYAAIFPALAAMVGNIGQQEQLQTTMRQARLGLLAFAVIAAMGALWLAQPILTLTYGSAYQPATLTLQILTLTLIPAMQNSMLIIFLYARNDEKHVNLLMAVGIAVNLSLCFWLIPRWGPAGTALALLVAESLLYFPYWYRVRKISTFEIESLRIGQEN